MASDSEERHIFYSSGAARAYSLLNDVKAQGVVDLVKEMSSSVNVKILSEKESLVAFLKSGTEIDDLTALKNVENFLRVIGETSKMHKIVAQDSSEKRIERYSEITLNFYKNISELGKSEAEDFSEFIHLFPLERSLSKGFVSHLPSFLKPYSELFEKSYNPTMKRDRVEKRKFSDYLAEFRWIARDVLQREGTKFIVVPDDYFAVGLAKELELYGIQPNLISAVPEALLNDSPYNFVIAALRTIYENFSYESIISLIENPYCDIGETKIAVVKEQSYEKNITRGIEDWITLFRDLKIESKILPSLLSISRSVEKESFLHELALFCNDYLGRHSYPSKVIDLLLTALPDYTNDIIGAINDLESLKYLPRVSSVGSSTVYIGKPLDMLGLSFDNLYIAGQDSATSIRAFPEDARDLLEKIGLRDAYDNFIEETYSALIASSTCAFLSRSMTDDRLSYTESTSFYDSVDANELYVPRDEIFVPIDPISDWEVRENTSVKNRYLLDSSFIKARMQKPIYPTFIENYIGCHFKGFINGLLGIDEIDTPREFLDPRTTGTLTHRILERYYSTDISPNEFAKLADSYVKSEINKERYQSRVEALRFYREKYLKTGKLSKFFIMDVRHALELGRKTIEKEFHFPTNNQQVFYEFKDNKISIGGYVDRVDQERDNLCVIDYKSSLYGYPRNDLCDERHGKIQLFFYKIGVESILKKKVTAAAYVSFRDVSDGFSTAGFYHTIPNEDAQIAKCKSIADSALEDFVGGDVDPVVKDGGSLWACENSLFCSLLSVCRVQERRW